MTLDRDPVKQRAWRTRSKPLARGKGPTRSRGLRARPLPIAERRRRSTVSDDVFRRDGGCRLAEVPEAGPCFGRLTPHHRRKASQGGAYSTQNLVTLCAHHNDQLEADADLAALAHRLGFVVRRGDSEWEDLGA